MKRKSNKSNISIGDVFFKLKVIEEPFSKKIGSTSRHYTSVECECGNVFTTKCTNLRIGRSKQCSDCSFKKRSENKVKISQHEQVFRRLILERCKKNNINIEINLEYFTHIIKQKCHYCNDEPRLTNRFSNRKYINKEDLYINGIDRKDSEIGYTINNCVPCCTSCNYAKHTLNYNEFLEKIHKIHKNLKL